MPKGELIPRELESVRGLSRKAPAAEEEAAIHQLVGEVTAHQGDDG